MVLVHGLRHAIIPTATLTALEAPMALGGAFVLERVFGLGGLGEATIRAVEHRDIPWLMALSFFAAAAVGDRRVPHRHRVRPRRSARRVPRARRQEARVTHLRVILGRVLRSRRATVGLAMPGVLALLACSRWFAAPAPIVATGPLRCSRRSSSTSASRPCRVRRRGALPRSRRPLAAGALRPDHPHLGRPARPTHTRAPPRTDARSRRARAARLRARTALGLSLGAILLSMALGTALGAWRACAGLRNDTLVRLVETVDTFPAIIVVALVRAIERTPSALSLVIAVAIVRWAEVARLVRAEVLRSSSEGYVLAARALGALADPIFYTHILRNAAAPS
ncbi:MAG: ABC transporter permease subunit [Polyangiaceae bacterium]